MSNISDLRKKTLADLHKLLSQKQEELRGLRFKKVGGELKNVSQLGETRRTIARILTLLRNGKE